MDLRIKRTRKMLREALWEEIAEKGYEGLTVSEVCSRAMINRATFYRHYEDMNDLLLRGLDELFDELYALGDRPFTAEEIERHPFDRPSKNLLLLFELFGERADFFRFMFSDRGVPSFVTRIRTYVEEIIIDRVKVATRPDSKPIVPVAIVARGWAGQIIGCLIWWLEKGQDLPAEDMAVYLTSIGFHTIFECLDINQPKLENSLDEALHEANERFYRVFDRETQPGL